MLNYKKKVYLQRTSSPKSNLYESSRYRDKRDNHFNDHDRCKGGNRSSKSH